MAVEATAVELPIAPLCAILYNVVPDPLHMGWNADKWEAVEQRLTT